jgi:hypothetical protein
MTPCTWSPDCPGDGTHRMERSDLRGGSVEFVCDEHVQTAQDQGYTHNNRADQGSTGAEL